MTLLGTYFRLSIPAIATLVLIIYTFLPLQISGWSSFVPMLDVLMVYFWAIYRPQLMPLWFIFLLGVFQDAFYGTFIDTDGIIPIGTTSLVLILIRTLVIAQQKVFIKETFIMVWCGFVIFALGAVLLEWVMFMGLAGSLYLPNEIIIQWAVTIMCYPLVHLINREIFKSLSKVELNA